VETSLLTTKLNIPPARPQLVTRPRLIERLEEGLNYRLILVSAPAGFGKTTLLSEWIHNDKLLSHTAWLSLEEGENDPVRFWDYFITALKTVQPEIGEKVLPLLHSKQQLPIESLLTILINDLTDVKEDFFMVLDDYHFIRTQAVHTGVNFLLEHLPLRMHLIIATRIDPPLPLAHFRGKGTILEIGADDLRFTMEEASNLFKESNFLKLRDEDIQALNVKAEGWVVGLQMAILSMRRESDISGFIISFTGSQRYIMEYLIEEVLLRQTNEMHDFLLNTSILERLSGPLCDAITRGSNGKELLSKLEDDNLFIIPLDPFREWYRYHHLFVELLRHRLEIECGKKIIGELHMTASQWYEENGFIEDAIHHAIITQHWQSAIRLISTTVVGGATLISWVQQIPKDTLLTDLELYFRYVSVLLETGLYSDTEACIDYVEKAMPDETRARVAAARTSLATLCHDMEHVEEYAKKALELLPPGRSPDRASVSLSLGGHYMQRSLYSQAQPLLIEALETYKETKNTTNTIIVLTYLGVIAISQGKKHQGKELFEQAISLAGQNPVAGAAHAYLGRRVYYEWNELEKTVYHLEQAVKLSETAKGMGARPFVFNYLAYTLIAQGDIEGAKDALDKSDRELIEMEPDPYLEAHNVAYHVALAIAEEDLESISRWLDNLSEYEATLPPDIPQCVRLLLFERKGKDAAEAKLQADFELYTHNGIQDPLIFLLSSRAAEEPSPEEALTLLRKAFDMAKPEGYVRTFVDQGMTLAPLLRKAITHRVEPEYARMILTIIENEERQRKIRNGEDPAFARKYGLLTKRELEVLKFIVDGLSNQQIAELLFVSLSTTKTHLHNIIEKLGAKNRTQAIARARELNLI